MPEPYWNQCKFSDRISVFHPDSPCSSFMLRYRTPAKFHSTYYHLRLHASSKLSASQEQTASFSRQDSLWTSSKSREKKGSHLGAFNVRNFAHVVYGKSTVSLRRIHAEIEALQLELIPLQEQQQQASYSKPVAQDTSPRCAYIVRLHLLLHLARHKLGVLLGDLLPTTCTTFSFCARGVHNSGSVALYR